MDARVVPLSRISFPQAMAGSVGVFGISLGVAGLVHTESGHPFFGVTSEELLGLALNPAHNVLHLLVGVAGLAVLRSLRASRAFGHVIYFFFVLQVLVGMVTASVPEWNLLGVDGADNLMHALLALVGLAIAWGPEHLGEVRRRRR